MSELGKQRQTEPARPSGKTRVVEPGDVGHAAGPHPLEAVQRYGGYVAQSTGDGIFRAVRCTGRLCPLPT